MYYDYQANDYLYKIHTIIEKQNNKIQKLEKQLEKLQAEINILKEKPTTIEYKFDQLKVETLSGTLNIGLSPYSDNIEDIYVNNAKENHPLEEKYFNLINEIKIEISSYLNNEVGNLIYQSSKKYNKQIDSAYTQLIIEDISKQLDQRIQLYINKLDRNVTIENENIKETIISKVKKDINNAIDIFLEHLPERN